MAKVRLTDRGIKKLQAVDGRQTDYFDKTTPNFGVRVSPKGTKSFCVFYRIGRRFRRLTIGTYPTLSLTKARSMGRAALSKVLDGKDPAQEKKIDRDAATFREIADEFLEKHSKPFKRSAAEDERIINSYLGDTLGKMRAKDITRRTVRELLEDIATGRLSNQDGPAPIMANRVLALTRKIFNWALAKDLLEANPCHALGAPGKEKTRDRVLSDEEIKKVWNAMGQESLYMGCMFKIRLLTAQRGGEVAKMRWQDLELESETPTWTIPGDFSKNGKMHRVPLSEPAVKILKQVKAYAEKLAKKPLKGRKEPRGMSQWAFPGRKEDSSPTELQKCIQRIRISASVDFRGHDLRRTAASKMTELGVPRLIVQKILNHADNEITAVYDRFAYDKEKRGALDTWARRLMIVTSGLKAAKQKA